MFDFFYDWNTFQEYQYVNVNLFSICTEFSTSFRENKNDQPKWKTKKLMLIFLKVNFYSMLDVSSLSKYMLNLNVISLKKLSQRPWNQIIPTSHLQVAGASISVQKKTLNFLDTLQPSDALTHYKFQSF